MPSIMILEDDKDLAEGIQMALVGDNLKFTLFETLQAAKNAFVKEHFDLLIIDINLPDGSGLQLCTGIRQTSRVAILLLTANDTELDGECRTYEKPPFVFKFETMEFYKNKKPIDLSRTEQKILYLLVFNSRQTIAKERLLEWVWPDGPQYVEDNALSVGIRRLRDKKA